MRNIFKESIGGLSIMFSVLFLLIGVTEYNEVFSSTKHDIIQSTDYVKTTLFQKQKVIPPKKEAEFSLEDDGEIMQIHDTSDGKLTQHYRAIPSPDLIDNYEQLPQLQLEVIDGDKKKWVTKEIYKINRNKGLIFFLLKLEKNHQTALTNLYTGNYKVSLIK